MISPDGQPVGTDFSNVYAAGKMVHEGAAPDVWDWQKHYAMEQAVFDGRQDGYYGWHYPPMFLFIAAVLAFFPYVWALIIWQISSFAGYFYSVRKIAGDLPGWLLPVVAFPAIFVNVIHGHNGFLSAMLFGLGMYFLNKKPILAGILIGLLAYKPHFGFLIPLALLAGGYYRTFFSASVTVLITAALATLTFGIEIWPSFIESLSLTRNVILEDGNTGWFKIQSAFSAIMNWGGSLGLAYAGQGLIALFVTITIVLAFRRPLAHEIRVALLIIGSLLFTPYFLDYDMIILAPALAFLAVHGLREGFKPYEVFLLLIVWFSPLATRALMMTTGIPFGFITTFSLFVLVASSVYQKRVFQ